ncbi:hypothetical protein Kisp01_69770 [Kineosporia sp. NBRC 101677]|nr:hypothetical protein Kisp01_69770 [Kineosporia sp. NBRC 101677]
MAVSKVFTADCAAVVAGLDAVNAAKESQDLRAITAASLPADVATLGIGCWLRGTSVAHKTLELMADGLLALSRADQRDRTNSLKSEPRVR